MADAEGGFLDPPSELLPFVGVRLFLQFDFTRRK